jgi:hypothetical protein
MKRAIAFAVTLTFVAGCSGGGLNGGSLLPGTRMPAAGLTGDGSHRVLDVNVTMRIPKRHRRERVAVHPATISSLTQSVSFVINGGAAQVFNATTSSPNCKAASSGKVCTFAVKAPPGPDSFIVTTYSAVSGGGTALDRAIATITIFAGKANAPSIRLGPVVSTAADTGTGSLRYAIGSANPGDTILFTIPKSSTITVASPLTLSTSVSIAGPGVSASVRRHRDQRNPNLQSDIAVSGLTINGGGTQQIFVINAGVKATISGLILHDGLATVSDRPGGAVYSEGAVTLSNDAFTDNGSQVDSPFVRVRQHVQHPRGKHFHGHAKRGESLHPHCTTAYYYGGAVYNHGQMAITSSIFDSNVLQSSYGCTYTYGGAIYTDQYGTLASSGNIYSNNSAYYGGAVYVNATYGQASFTGDKFIGNFNCSTTTGCALSGCGTATSHCTTYPSGSGGAIYDGAGPGITVTTSQFTSNYSGGQVGSSVGSGGALYLATGSPNISGTMFTGNLAGGGTANCSSGQGGAIYEDAGNTLELDNDTFTSNKAGGDDSSYGGAIYNDAEPDNGSGNTFTSNQAYGTGGACSANAYASGGGIYANYGITMSGSKFVGNSATSSEDSWGGAIYEDDPSLLTSDTFTSNSAVATGLHSATDAETYGGAIYGDDSIRIAGTTFTSNSATAQGATGADADGGALYLDSGTVTSTGNSFSSNGARIPAGTGTTSVYGGAVYVATTFISNGDKYTSNAASGKNSVYGGALYLDSSFGLTNGTFTSNKVTATGGESYGGAVGIGSSGTMSNSTISSNSSSSTGYAHAYDQGGGGIYDDAGSTLNGLKITSNTVTGGSGGGIYVRDSTELLNNSTISGNSVSVSGTYGGGGGIYNYLGMSITNTTISGNTAAVNGNYSGGGGLYVDDTTDVAGSTISGNKVTGSGTLSGGGGVYDFYYAFDATNTTISSNTSALDGGGVEFYYNPTSALNNVTIYQNSATGNGAGIYNEPGSTSATLANTIVGGSSGNKDVYNAGTITSMGYNILQTNPTGGGTYTAGTGDKTANPVLLGLSNNGGPTFTNADQSTSPGKAYVPWTSASGGTCGTVTGMSNDQRGFSRGAANKCDVGAYELSGLPSVTRIHPHVVRPDPRKPRPKRHAKHVPAHERSAGR